MELKLEASFHHNSNVHSRRPNQAASSHATGEGAPRLSCGQEPAILYSMRPYKSANLVRSAVGVYSPATCMVTSFPNQVENHENPLATEQGQDPLFCVLVLLRSSVSCWISLMDGWDGDKQEIGVHIWDDITGGADSYAENPELGLEDVDAQTCQSRPWTEADRVTHSSKLSNLLRYARKHYSKGRA
jgi:hypothetical protein